MLTGAEIGNVDAQRGGQLDLVILFLHENVANLLGQGVLAQRVALADAFPIIEDRLVFVVQIEAQHFFRLLRRLDGLGRHLRHAAQVVDLLGNPGNFDEALQVEDATVRSGGLAALSVLVAEDNVVNLKVIEALLKSLAIDAEFLLDGKAVLEHYCSAPERYNVILMDCEMPNMDGFEAARQIRAFEQQQQIRPVAICALTAHALDDIARRCQDAGMDHVLIKPIDLGMLTRQLQYYVDHSTGSPHQP